MKKEDNPCYICPDKNYAAGCSVGCERREAALARDEEEKRKRAQANAPEELLTRGYYRRKKYVRRHEK